MERAKSSLLMPQPVLKKAEASSVSSDTPNLMSCERIDEDFVGGGGGFGAEVGGFSLDDEEAEEVEDRTRVSPELNDNDDRVL